MNLLIQIPELLDNNRVTAKICLVLGHSSGCASLQHNLLDHDFVQYLVAL